MNGLLKTCYAKNDKIQQFDLTYLNLNGSIIRKTIL